jgi:hypothetical protein
MDIKKAPPAAGEDQRRGEQLDTSNITLFPKTGKPPRMPESEYRRLSSLPFSSMTREESVAVCAETRRQLAGIRLRGDSREFEGAYHYERGLLSCLMAGAPVPSGITADTLLMPRHRVILEALRNLEALGVRGNIQALTAWLDKTGGLEKAGGESCVREIEGMIGIPSAVTAFAAEVLLLALRRLS